MSADNYTHCPNCYVQNEARDKLYCDFITLSALSFYNKYGALSESDIKAAYDSYAGKVKPLHDCTLREDYSFSLSVGGILQITYSAGCNVCGFDYSYTKEVNVLITEGSDV